MEKAERNRPEPHLNEPTLPREPALTGATRFARIRAQLEAFQPAPGPASWLYEFLLFGFKSAIVWLAIAGIVGAVLLKTDPGYYREATFGDWVRKIAHQNIGQLVTLGADKRSKSLWIAIAAMLEDVSGVPADQIGLETFLWPREKRHAA